tara:strand:+ start:753 stop:1160 length:408 start_codon:yes stop_codon:yes gene_type:complete
MLLLPEELISNAVIPKLRSMIALKLIDQHHLTQNQVAKKMNLTQAAVSNYIRKTRGNRLDLETCVELQTITSIIAKLFTNEIIDNKMILSKFQEAINFVKNNKLLCEYHIEMEPNLDLTKCDICEDKHLISITKY